MGRYAIDTCSVRLSIYGYAVTNSDKAKHGASDAQTDSVKLKMHLQSHNRMEG